MSRRRRNVERHASDYLSQMLVEKVKGLMDNRHRLLAPFPFDPDIFYPYYWTPQELEAIQIVKRFPNMVYTTRGISVRMPLTGNVSGKRIMAQVGITMQIEQPCPPGPLEAHVLPDDIQSRLRKWVAYWYKLDMEKTKLVKKIEEVAKVCKTYGQVARIWPDLEGFFPEYGRQKIAKAKVRSSIPDAAFIWTRDAAGNPLQQMLQERFQPTVLAPYAEMLAECLMLPVTPGVHVAKVQMTYL